MSTRIGIGTLVTILALALGTTSTTVAKVATVTTSGALELTECTVPGAADALCGKYRVFEDRAAGKGRTIDLNVVVLPARSKNKEPDPIFFLHGGPGAAATGIAPLFARSGLRQKRDIVLLDQRGTGGSNPLQCDLGGLTPLLAAVGDFDLDLDSCRDAFDADLRLYTTPIAVDDLEDVRKALGAKKINLYGASYGTRVALEYARRYPKHARTLVLRGVAPPSLSIPLWFARDSQAALDHVLDDCAADERCHEAFPKSRAELASVFARLSEKPATVEVRDPYTGDEIELTVTRDLFAASLHYGLYGAGAAAGIPLAIHDAQRGEFRDLIRQTIRMSFQLGTQIHLGMLLAVTCTEDAPFFTTADAKRAAAGTYLGDLAAQNQLRSCEGWPRGTLPGDFKRPVKSDVAALLISGEADPVTPPRYAAEAVKHLPNGAHIVLRGTGHSNMTPGCVGALIRRFIDAASTKSLDLDCTTGIARPTFRVP